MGSKMVQLASHLLSLLSLTLSEMYQSTQMQEVAEGVPAATDISAETIEEDFQIFKRVAPASQPPVESPAEINEDDEVGYNREKYGSAERAFS